MGWRTLMSMAAVALLGGCAGPSTRVESYRLPTPPQGLVLVLDGAGGNGEATKATANAIEAAREPYYVRTFHWTHGVGRGFADMTDIANGRRQAKVLAGNISWYRASYPKMPITIVAYSAGSHVALEAMNYLEPNAVEEIILLAPAVSADYDLRRALIASRRGIDVFTSSQDAFYLGLGTGVVGTADGKTGVPAAGRFGFDPPELPADEAGLAQKLREHPWNSSLTWSGNYGEHQGTLQPEYFRAYVLPLITNR